MDVIPYSHARRLHRVGRPTATDEKSEALRAIVRAISCGGIAYVSDVKAVDDLPEWASAALVGGTAYVPETLES